MINSVCIQPFISLKIYLKSFKYVDFFTHGGNLFHNELPLLKNFFYENPWCTVVYKNPYVNIFCFIPFFNTNFEEYSQLHLD